MRNFTRSFVTLSLAVAALFTLSSCEKDPENNIDDPGSTTTTPVIGTATLQEGTLTDVSVTIDITYQDATAIYYSYFESSSSSEDWASVEVDASSTSTSITLSDLAAEMEYTAEFYAVNGDEQSQTIDVTFTTTETPVVETISVSNIVVGSLMVSMDVTIDKSACDGFAYYYSNTEWYNASYFLGDLTGGWGKYVEESGTLVFGGDYYLSQNTAYTLEVAAYIKNDDGTYSVVGDVIAYECTTLAAEVGTSDATIEIAIDDSLTSITGFGGKIYNNDNIGGYYMGYVAASEATSGAEAWVSSSAWLSGYSAYAVSFVGYDYNWETGTATEIVYDERDFTISSLADNTEYIVFAIPVDTNGNLGQLSSATVTTSSLNVDDSIKPIVTCTPSDTSAQFEFDFNGCDKVFYMNVNSTDSWTTAESVYSMFLSDLSTMYYGWSSESAVDGKISYTQDYLSIGNTYIMYYLGVAADGTLGAIQALSYTTLSPSYDSSASLTLSVESGQAYYMYGTDYPDYLYAIATFNVEMANGATSYYWAAVDKAAIMNQTSMEAWGDYVVGSYYKTLSSSSQVAEVYLGTKDYKFVAVPMDADGNYGAPQYIDFDGWDSPIMPENEGGGDDGVDPMM